MLISQGEFDSFQFEIHSAVIYLQLRVSYMSSPGEVCRPHSCSLGSPFHLVAYQWSLWGESFRGGLMSCRLKTNRDELFPFPIINEPLHLLWRKSSQVALLALLCSRPGQMVSLLIMGIPCIHCSCVFYQFSPTSESIFKESWYLCTIWTKLSCFWITVCLKCHIFLWCIYKVSYLVYSVFSPNSLT